MSINENRGTRGDAANSASGASAFIDLTDAPASYAGANSKIVAVKSDASGLEFIDTAVSSWISFTPTGSWTTNVTYTGFYRKVGNTLDVRFKMSFTGASDATQLKLYLPSGWQIDSTKTFLNCLSPCGQLSHGDVDVAWYVGTLIFDSTNADVVAMINGSSLTITHLIGIDGTYPSALANGDVITGVFSVPVIAV